MQGLPPSVHDFAILVPRTALSAASGPHTLAMPATSGLHVTTYSCAYQAVQEGGCVGRQRDAWHTPKSGLPASAPPRGEVPRQKSGLLVYLVSWQVRPASPKYDERTFFYTTPSLHPRSASKADRDAGRKRHSPLAAHRPSIGVLAGGTHVALLVAATWCVSGNWM